MSVFVTAQWPSVPPRPTLPSRSPYARAIAKPRSPFARPRSALRRAPATPWPNEQPPARYRSPFAGLCAVSPGKFPKFPQLLQFSRRRRTFVQCQDTTQQLHLRMSRSAHLRAFGGPNGDAPRPRERPQRAQAVPPRPVSSFRPAPRLMYFGATFQKINCSNNASSDTTVHNAVSVSAS